MELENAKKDIEHKDMELERIRNDIEQINEEIGQVKESKLELIKINEHLSNRMNDMKSIVYKAINQSIDLSTTKLFKFVHLIYRIKHQLVKGNIVDKRKFFAWFIKRLNKNVYINDHRYNPIYQIIDILNESKDINNVNDYLNSNTCKNLNKSFDISEKKLENNENMSDAPASENLKVNITKDKYDKFDVILLSIINYDFRYQRPQHLASVFAKNGHRVFYINANFNKIEKVYNKQCNNIKIYNIRSSQYDNIYTVDNEEKSKEISYSVERIVNENAIRDCIIIVEYPTWVQTAKFLKKKYGFKVVTDYLDDYTGFKETSSDYLINSSIELLKMSDSVIASSNYLAQKACEYNYNVEIVRNGTEFEHFNKACRLKSCEKKRKVVGYYGAIAHWFDFDKIEYLAENLIDIDIVLIGAVTEGYDRLSKYSNVKLLGEKPYKDLPNYLKNFDVCLIPFNTTTNLIKATNPVKFYEYLSAGKKIVATEIPELISFKDKYVYLANDNNKFFEYVKICIEGSDNLASNNECIEFAKNNDWCNRGKAFLEYSKRVFPKVSIIVLTYNQLEYTEKCISSIINKTAYPNYELIIVDNNSCDNTQEYLKQIEKQYIHVKVILNEKNYGFAGGNNIGIKYSSGEYFIFLNNDTVVTRGWITGLLKHFDNNQRLGLVGPVTNSIGNEAMIKTDYDTLESMDIFAYDYTTKLMGAQYKDISTLAMFCVAISRRTFEAVGYLDENYKVGMFEDDDYSFAALKKGYDITCAEDVFVHHFGSVSFKKLENKEYKAIFENNKKYYEKKWNTKWIPHKYREGIM